jgi:hypothetical protein
LPRVLLAVSLVSRRGWVLGAEDVADQPSTYPVYGSRDYSVLNEHEGIPHYRVDGMYFTAGQPDHVEAWAVQYGFHVVRRRMVFPDGVVRRRLAAFAPIWIDPVRHAIIVDTGAFADFFTDVENPHRFSANAACRFFAQACFESSRKMCRFFTNLFAAQPVGYLPERPESQRERRPDCSVENRDDAGNNQSRREDEDTDEDLPWDGLGSRDVPGHEQHVRDRQPSGGPCCQQQPESMQSETRDRAETDNPTVSEDEDGSPPPLVITDADGDDAAPIIWQGMILEQAGGPVLVSLPQGNLPSPPYIIESDSDDDEQNALQVNVTPAELLSDSE